MLILVDTSNGETKDSTYYKSEFASLSDLIAAKDALAAEIASEGAVLFKNLNNTLPLDVASDVPGGVRRILSQLYALLGQTRLLDLTPLKRLLDGEALT